MRWVLQQWQICCKSNFSCAIPMHVWKQFIRYPSEFLNCAASQVCSSSVRLLCVHRLVAASKGLFARRQDFSSFNILPRHKVNSYHIKVSAFGVYLFLGSQSGWSVGARRHSITPRVWMRARHKIIIANTLFSAFYHSLGAALRAVKGCRRRLALAARAMNTLVAHSPAGELRRSHTGVQFFCTQQTLFITSLRTAARVCNCTNLFQKTAFISSVCHRRTTFVITFSARRHNSNLNMKCWDMRCYQRRTKFWLCFASLGIIFLKIWTWYFMCRVFCTNTYMFSNSIFKRIVWSTLNFKTVY